MENDRRKAVAFKVFLFYVEMVCSLILWLTSNALALTLHAIAWLGHTLSQVLPDVYNMFYRAGDKFNAHVEHRLKGDESGHAPEQ